MVLVGLDLVSRPQRFPAGRSSPLSVRSRLPVAAVCDRRHSASYLWSPYFPRAIQTESTTA
jgi:hypothetical protein